DRGSLRSFGASEGLKAGQWCSFAYDENGDLSMANSTFLGRYTNGAFVRVDEDFGDRICIAPCRSGGLWVASNEQLCRLEREKVTFRIPSPPWSGAARVRALFEDRSGALWIGTSARGLFHFANGELMPVATSHPS